MERVKYRLRRGFIVALLIYQCTIQFNVCMADVKRVALPGSKRTFFPPANPKAIYFTGAGMYFWWQAGAAKYIQENCEYSNMPMIGASAGSLTSTLLLSNVDFNKAAEAALKIGKTFNVYGRKTGLAGIWGEMLKTWLQEIIPNDIPPETYDRLQIAVSPYVDSLFNRKKLTPYLVSGFKCKEDIIEACMASCHVPIFLDGRATTYYRGEKVLDGSFWYFVTKDRTTGLPIPTSVKIDDILWIDYCDDDDFMQSISGNILELPSTPEKIFDMMDDGYKFMKREHYNRRLPIAKFERPDFVYKSNLIENVDQGGRIVAAGAAITGACAEIAEIATQLPS